MHKLKKRCTAAGFMVKELFAFFEKDRSMRLLLRFTYRIWLWAALLQGLGAAGVCAAADMAPLRVENRYPPHLMFLSPRADVPDTPGRGRLRASLVVDYTSLYVNETSEDWSVLMDMEMTTLALDLAYGLTSALELNLSLPWYHMADGFMDRALEDYHDTFGFPNYGKDARPYDQFGYYLRKDGEDWFEPEPDRFAVGDGCAGFKLRLLAGGERRPAAALAYKLKLPFGDADAGFGSGRIDHGAFVLTRWPFWRFALHLSPGYVWLSDPHTRGAEVTMADMAALLSGLTFDAGRSLCLKAQLNYYTSPFSRTGISQLDQDSLQLSLGFSVRLSRRMGLELALSEDLTRAAPDFTVHTRWIFTPVAKQRSDDGDRRSDNSQ